MTSSNLIRWDGLAAMLGGLLLFISGLWSLFLEGPLSEVAGTTSWAIVSGLALLSAVLMLLALVGLHLHHLKAAGILGFVGFLVAFLGTALVVGTLWTFAFVVPSLAVEAPELLGAEQVAGPVGTGVMLSSIVFAVGWALFGIAALRARLYPRWLAIALIVVALVQLVPIPATVLVFAPVLALLGFFAVSGKGVSTDE